MSSPSSGGRPSSRAWVETFNSSDPFDRNYIGANGARNESPSSSVADRSWTGSRNSSVKLPQISPNYTNSSDNSRNEKYRRFNGEDVQDLSFDRTRSTKNLEETEFKRALQSSPSQRSMIPADVSSDLSS